MSQTFYPVSIWTPTPEALLSLKDEVSRLSALHTQRTDYITHVENQTTAHIRNAVLINDLLTQDLFAELSPEQAELVAQVDDESEDEDLFEYDSLEEERQSKNVSRDKFKKVSEVYKRIQRICHPDKTPHKQLHDLAVQASKLAEGCELVRLLVLFSHAKVLKTKLDSYINTISSALDEYLELERERDAYVEMIESSQQSYENSRLYATDRDLFLESALGLALDDIEDTIRVYKSHGAEVSDDLKERIAEIDPELIDRVYQPIISSKSGYNPDDFFSIFNRDESVDLSKDISRLFPDED